MSMSIPPKDPSRLRACRDVGWLTGPQILKAVTEMIDNTGLGVRNPVHVQTGLRKNYSHLRAENFHGGINGSISTSLAGDPLRRFIPLKWGIDCAVYGLRRSEDPTAGRQLKVIPESRVSRARWTTGAAAPCF